MRLTRIIKHALRDGQRDSGGTPWRDRVSFDVRQRLKV